MTDLGAAQHSVSKGCYSGIWAVTGGNGWLHHHQGGT